MGSAQYRNVLKSSSMIGGSALVNMLIGMVRTKFVAMILGPGGMGLAGLYVTILGPISAVSGMGIVTSGVRQIAAANGRNDKDALSVTVTVLRRTVWVTGLLGFAATVTLSPLLSKWTFGDATYALPIAILGLTVLLGNIKDGQGCILQGTRKIASIAKISIWGAVNGTLISIPCFYFWGRSGIVASLVLCAVAALFVSWWYARRVDIRRVKVTGSDMVANVKALLGFGFPLMLNGLMASATAYLLRLIVLKRFDLSGVGIWSSAFNISFVLVSFVLQAMGTDYYPRLASVSHDDRQIAEEVNVQEEVGSILALPGIVATLLFAPLGVQMLYSEKFLAAIPILRWSVFGILGKVITWPFGFIVLAKGRGTLFLTLETAAQALQLVTMYFCSETWGLTGTGVAFAAYNMIYSIIIFVVSWKIAKTRLSLRNIKLIISIFVIAVGCALLHRVLPDMLVYYGVSVLIFVGICIFSSRRISQTTGLNMKWLKARFGRKHEE